MPRASDRFAEPAFRGQALIVSEIFRGGADQAWRGGHGRTSRRLAGADTPGAAGAGSAGTALDAVASVDSPLPSSGHRDFERRTIGEAIPQRQHDEPQLRSGCARPAVKEYPGFAGKPLGATGTLLIEVEGVDALHDRLVPSVTIVMAIETEFYGMREFPLRIRMAM